MPKFDITESVLFQVSSCLLCQPHQASELLIKHSTQTSPVISDKNQNIGQISNNTIHDRNEVEVLPKRKSGRKSKRSRLKQKQDEDKVITESSLLPEPNLNGQEFCLSNRVDDSFNKHVQESEYSATAVKRKENSSYQKKRPVTAKHRTVLKPKSGKIRPQSAWTANDNQDDSNIGPGNKTCEEIETEINKIENEEETRVTDQNKSSIEITSESKESMDIKHESSFNEVSRNRKQSKVSESAKVRPNSTKDLKNKKSLLRKAREFPEPPSPIAIDEIRNFRESYPEKTRPKTSFHAEKPEEDKVYPQYPSSAPESPSRTREGPSTVSVQLTGYPAQRIQVTTDHMMGSVVLYLTRSFSEIRDNEATQDGHFDNLQLVID